MSTDEAAATRRETWTRVAEGLDRRLGRPPGRTALLATLTDHFGPVRLLAEWTIDKPPPKSVRWLLQPGGNRVRGR